MPRYWWVNHKQTFIHEIEGRYLWSPKTNKGGTRSEYYNNMRRATPGDHVLSFADQTISYVGRVGEFAFTAQKPTEFGAAGANWANEGWYLPVFWTPLSPLVRPKDFIDLLRPLLPSKYSPIRTSGDGNQVYLTSISQELFEAVISVSTFDYERLIRGGANSLNYQTIKDELDDRVESALVGDLTLDSTTKEAVINARRGQGKFRSNVETVEKSCRLTGVTNPSLLIASHIRPWRSCETAQQRLDAMNGLLLTPDADLLFDRGFITFENDGEMRVSSRFDLDDLRRLGLAEPAWKQLGFSEAPMTWNAQAFRPAQQDYLAYHRANVYVGETAH